MKGQKIEKHGQKTPNFGQFLLYICIENAQRPTIKFQKLFHSARYLYSVKSGSSTIESTFILTKHAKRTPDPPLSP